MRQFVGKPKKGNLLIVYNTINCQSNREIGYEKKGKTIFKAFTTNKYAVKRMMGRAGNIYPSLVRISFC